MDRLLPKPADSNNEIKSSARDGVKIHEDDNLYASQTSRQLLIPEEEQKDTLNLKKLFEKTSKDATLVELD